MVRMRLLDHLVALLRRDQRILGLDAQHQLHAAVQIESEFEGFLDRVDDPETQRDDADDDEHTIASARAEKRTHDCSCLQEDTPVACVAACPERRRGGSDQERCVAEVERCGGERRSGRAGGAGDLEDARDARGAELGVDRRGLPHRFGDDGNRVVRGAPLLVRVAGRANRPRPRRLRRRPS